MFIIDKRNQITLTKGDTATMLIEIHDLDDNVYEIKSTDVITLTVRKTTASDIVLQKEAQSDHHIVIASEDTSELDVGLYMYDVQLVTEDGYVYTIIPQNYFRLTGEVTYA